MSPRLNIRMPRFETLDRRTLLAADVAPFLDMTVPDSLTQNAAVSTDGNDQSIEVASAGTAVSPTIEAPVRLDPVHPKFRGTLMARLMASRNPRAAIDSAMTRSAAESDVPHVCYPETAPAAPSPLSSPPPAPMPLDPPALAPPPAPENVVWTEDAESGTGGVVDGTSAGYTLIQSDVVAEGEHAFRIAHPNATSESFTIDRSLPIGNDTKLFFMSQLSWATSSQVAKVQVSVDGGNSWPHEVFSQAGTGDPGESGFALREVDLSGFAGQEIRIRFRYQFNSGSYYPDTSPGVGWHVDNIQVADSFQKSLHSIGDPSPIEQFYLELINRARADAIAEAERLAATTDPDILNAYTFFGIDPDDIVYQFTQQVSSGEMPLSAQPLSFHSALLEAAELHSQDLLTNEFQGHVSSDNPPSPFQPGFGPTQRAEAVGYNGGVGENVFSYSRSAIHGHAGFNVDWGYESPEHPNYNPEFAGQGMQNPAGHRLNIHRGDYREIGVGVVEGTNGRVGPQLVTQNFAFGAAPLITGVIFEDENDNGFYDPGEGLPGVRVDVDGSAHYAISSESGGYSVPVSSDGTHQVTFSGGGFAAYHQSVDVNGGENVKLDYVDPPPEIVPTVESVVLNGGNDQRSLMESVTITFNTTVEIDDQNGPAFIVSNRDTGETVDSQSSIANDDGKTVATFQFPRRLDDGNYLLVIAADRVQAGTVSLDGDGDGHSGGDFRFGDVATDDFFRLYGDADGSGTVNLYDFRSFRAAFGTTTASERFDPSLDAIENGQIDLYDFREFRANFGRSRESNG